MKEIGKKQFVLVCSPPILCSSMLFLMPFLTDRIGKTSGFIMGFCMYWFVFCLPISLYSANGIGELKKMYAQKPNGPTAKRLLYYLLALIPCIGTFFAVFQKIAFLAGPWVIGLAFLFALINGWIEELFWRGCFNQSFKNNIVLAYIYPTIFFGIWHVGVYFAKGMEYQGGFASLVGGSFLMGLLWGGVAYKTKSIQVVTAAHILTNFFAFTGLIYQNWFQ